MKMRKQSISDFPVDQYQGKRVFLRVDFNVPIEDGKIREDYRLRRTIPTIEYLSKRGAKVIVASHLGKPKGKPVPELSLKPVAERLIQILRVPAVRFIEHVVGRPVETVIDTMNPGEVLLLENLRFDPGEENNDAEFCRRLRALGDLYVNEAFGTMHRAHASTYGVAQLFPALIQVRDTPARPFTVVAGGIKIKDKLSALRTLIPKADRVFLGGGIAFTFLTAQGLSMGDSPVEQEFLFWAKDVLVTHGKKIYLPKDHVITKNLHEHTQFQIVQGAIPAGFKGVDIGRTTIQAYTRQLIEGDGTIFWNGPVGAWEIGEFAEGTVDIARAMALAHWRGAMTVIGGGDTVAALHRAEVLESEVTHVSTGGGAALLFIGGEELPGLSVLTDLI